VTSLDTGIDPVAFHALKDRMDVTDVLYRYASTIDSKDYTVLRSVLADDLWAQYGPMEPVIGADQVMSFIIEYTKTAVWQHHMLSVYHVDVDGDHAKALVYHTSRQLFEEDPETMNLLVARAEIRRGSTPPWVDQAPGHSPELGSNHHEISR
jgi:hypothetical protein